MEYMDEGKVLPTKVEFDHDALKYLILTGLGEVYEYKSNYAASNVFFLRIAQDEVLFSKGDIDQQMYINLSIGDNYWRLGKQEDALNQYQMIIKSEPPSISSSDEALTNYAQAVLYAQTLNEGLPAIEAYLQNWADYEDLGKILEGNPVVLFTEPATLRNKYLLGTLYLSCGLYDPAITVFSGLQQDEMEMVLPQERDTLHALCYTGIGKAQFAKGKMPVDDILKYFRDAYPLIPPGRCDLLADNLFWRAQLMLKEADMEGYYDCMCELAENPNIGALTDDISLAYVKAAQEAIKQRNQAEPDKK